MKLFASRCSQESSVEAGVGSRACKPTPDHKGASVQALVAALLNAGHLKLCHALCCDFRSHPQRSCMLGVRRVRIVYGSACASALV